MSKEKETKDAQDQGSKDFQNRFEFIERKYFVALERHISLGCPIQVAVGASHDLVGAILHHWDQTSCTEDLNFIHDPDCELGLGD